MEENKEKIVRVWDNYQEVCDVQKTERTKFIVSAAIRDGVRYINIREFYNKVGTDDWQPTRYGIAIPIIMPIEKGTKYLKVYLNFAKALKETLEVLKSLPIYDDENKVIHIKNSSKNKEKGNEDNA